MFAVPHPPVPLPALEDDEQIVALRRRDMRAMLHEAIEHGAAAGAERGARLALERVGLGDDMAASDVRRIRDLLAAGKAVTRGMLMRLGALVLVLLLTILGTILFRYVPWFARLWPL